MRRRRMKNDKKNQKKNSHRGGIDVLHNPEINKSTAFTEAEREALGLTGLLPSDIDTEEIQVRRVMQQLGDKPTDLERYIYLIGLLDTNETLFYKVVMSNPARRGRSTRIVRSML